MTKINNRWDIVKSTSDIKDHLDDIINGAKCGSGLVNYYRSPLGECTSFTPATGTAKENNQNDIILWFTRQDGFSFKIVFSDKISVQFQNTRAGDTTWTNLYVY